MKLKTALIDIDVHIYSMDSSYAVAPIYISQGKHESNSIYLHLYDDHLSYVTNSSSYLGKYRSISCSRCFDHMGYWKSHRGLCAQASAKDFNFDHFKSTKKIDKLELDRIMVPSEERKFESFSTFDCKAMLVKIPFNAGRTRWITEHKVISMSVFKCGRFQGTEILHE